MPVPGKNNWNASIVNICRQVLGHLDLSVVLIAREDLEDVHTHLKFLIPRQQIESQINSRKLKIFLLSSEVVGTVKMISEMFHGHRPCTLNIDNVLISKIKNVSFQLKS